jgi:hypothetical protein
MTVSASYSVFEPHCGKDATWMRVSVAFNPTPTRSTIGCFGTGLFYGFSSRARAFRWDVVEADEVDVLAFAVFGDLEQVENAEEAGGACELGSDVGKADRFDGVNLDVAVFHWIAFADGDACAQPEAHGAGDPAGADAFAKAFGEDHCAASLHRRR